MKFALLACRSKNTSWKGFGDLFGQYQGGNASKILALTRNMQLRRRSNAIFKVEFFRCCSVSMVQ